MTVAMLDRPSLGLAGGVGPYRLGDWEDLPSEPRCELIYGRFFASSSPSPLHQIVLYALFRLLEDSAEVFGGLVLGAPLDLRLFDHSVVQPDLMVFSAHSRSQVRERVEAVPELIIEILSPGTVRQDRGEKLRLYGESGIREYWLVDPAERQIDFLVLQESRYSVALPTGLQYHSQALEGLTMDLGLLWARVDAKLDHPET